MIDLQLHVACDVKLSNSVFYKYHEFLEQLDAGACMFACNLSPAHPPAILCFEQSLIQVLVESFFGGASEPTEDAVAREFSATEKRFADRLKQCVIEAMNNLWGDCFKATDTGAGILGREKVKVLSSESSVVMNMQFCITTGERETSFYLVLPWQAVQSVRSISGLGSGDSREINSKWAQAMQSHVDECNVEIHGLLAETQVNVEQLVNMKVGDFIPLGEKTTAIFMIEETVLFDAAIGTTNDRVSANVVRWLKR